MVEIYIGDTPDTLKVITKIVLIKHIIMVLRQFMQRAEHTGVVVKIIFGMKHLN